MKNYTRMGESYCLVKLRMRPVFVFSEPHYEQPIVFICWEFSDNHVYGKGMENKAMWEWKLSPFILYLYISVFLLYYFLKQSILFYCLHLKHKRWLFVFLDLNFCINNPPTAYHSHSQPSSLNEEEKEKW